jgi:hypothetical protein
MAALLNEYHFSTTYSGPAAEYNQRILRDAVNEPMLLRNAPAPVPCKPEPQRLRLPMPSLPYLSMSFISSLFL